MRKKTGYDPATYFDMEPGYYDRVLHEGNGIQWFWQYHRLRLVYDSIPADSRRLIDLGCGPGTFLGVLAADCPYAVGVDLASPQIDYARRRYRREGLEFQQADVLSFRAEEPFDAAVGIELIEHLAPDQTQPFLSAVRKLLKPGGTLVLTTPNYRSLWPMIEWLISKIGPVNYLAQHINPFTKRRLVSEVEKAGFSPVACRTFFTFAPFLAALSRGAAKQLHLLERRLIPWAGSELLLVARKP